MPGLDDLKDKTNEDIFAAYQKTKESFYKTGTDSQVSVYCENSGEFRPAICTLALRRWKILSMKASLQS